MDHMKVVKDTELRRLLYGVDEAPALSLRIERVEFNLSGEVPVAQVTGDVVSADDDVSIMAVFNFEPTALATSKLTMHIAQYLYGHGKKLPASLEPAVNEAAQREVLRIFQKATKEPKQVFDVMRSVQLTRVGALYACDHESWADVPE